FSETQKDSILGLLRSLGVTTPSLNFVLEFGRRCAAICGVQTKSLTTLDGKTVHYNPIAEIVKLELAKEDVCKNLVTLPVFDGPIIELYHSEKWHNQIPTPMVR
ncbi:hypothetical protein DFJ73DRAFT_922921, partial [Zopfochytrium polystomum]